MSCAVREALAPAVRARHLSIGKLSPLILVITYITSIIIELYARPETAMQSFPGGNLPPDADRLNLRAIP